MSRCSHKSPCRAVFLYADAHMLCIRRGPTAAKGTRPGQLLIQTTNDLRNAYRKYEIESKDDWSALRDKEQVVLDVFEAIDGEGRTYFGCFLTSREVFSNVLEAHNKLGNIHLLADGKKKLEQCGWELCPIGTSTKRWDSDTHQHCVSFRPFGYIFTKAETIVSNASGFMSLQVVLILLFLAQEKQQ